MGEVLKVDIQDYQNIKKVSLELEKGLTVIIGKTNDGKSSIMRAINDFIFNSGDDEDVRAGRKSYAISMDNGRGSAVYTRSNIGKNKKSSYDVGGEVLTKIGRSQIEEIASLFNISEVKLKNNQKVKLNFWFQQEKPFLTDKTDTQLFEFLSLSSSEEFIKVLKAIKEDTKEVSTSITKATTAIDTIKEVNGRYRSFIAQNEDFDRVYNRAVVVNNEVHKLSGISSCVDRTEVLKHRFIEKSSAYKESKVDYDLVTVVYDKVTGGYREVEVQSVLLGEVSILQGRVQSLNERFADRDSAYKKAKVDYDRADSVLVRVSEDYSNLIEGMALVSSLSGIVTKIEPLRSKLGVADSRRIEYQSKYDNIDLVVLREGIEMVTSMTANIDSLSKQIQMITALKGKYAEKVDEEQTTRQIYDKCLEEVENLEQEMGNCPLCGSVLGDVHGC